MQLVSYASGPLEGRIALPGDKSISHRALIMSALAVGTSEIRGLLEGADVRATWTALERLGVTIERTGGVVRVHGVGTGGLAAPDDVLDLGNSGTGARLLMGVLAGHGFPAILTGDASLRRRPMARVVEPLSAMGATFTTRAGTRLPLSLVGAGRPRPLDHASPVASAQVKSAILLAGLHAPGRTSVSEPAMSRDHTENMLRAMGADVRTSTDAAGRHVVSVAGEADLRPTALAVPSDPSSAAFPLVAALLTPGSELRLDGVGLNPTRAALFDVLRQMGAAIAVENPRTLGGEPVGDLVVKGSTLRGIEVAGEHAPAMIDEYPILAVAAALAQGRTVMRGVGELRVKETDRLKVMAQGLAAAGVMVEEGEDWLAVTGTAGAGGQGGAALAAQGASQGASQWAPQGGNIVDARHDHRIAMSFAVLGLLSLEPITIDGAETIETSFPGFVPAMRSIGCRLESA